MPTGTLLRGPGRFALATLLAGLEGLDSIEKVPHQDEPADEQRAEDHQRDDDDDAPSHEARRRKGRGVEQLAFFGCGADVVGLTVRQTRGFLLWNLCGYGGRRR